MLNPFKLAWIFVLLVVLGSFLGRGGAGARGGRSARPPDDYRAAAERLVEAFNADDPDLLAAALSAGVRGGELVRVREAGRDMLRRQGPLSVVSRAVSGRGAGQALVNAARGGWVLTLRLDQQGRIRSLQAEPQ